MQIVSEAFVAAMESKPYIARITLDGIDIIQDNAVQEIYFRGGANSNEEQLMLGCTVSGSVEIILDKSLVDCEIKGREMFVELGQDLGTGVEWLPMGTYTVESAEADDGVITAKAQDALYAKFGVEYEPLDGINFDSEDGVTSTALLKALCDRRGIGVDLSGLEPIAIKAKPDGFTERQIIGFISALYGGYANISRLGVLRICGYTESDVKVTADNYYEDGMEKATYDFKVGWLKCYNEATDLTMFVGDFNAEQGIYIESIWMNQAILNGIWERLQNFRYHPAKGISFLGNPLIDPGDIIQLEDLSGEVVSVPVMTLSHEFDGGIITTITASGQAKTVSNDGPTKKAIFRNAKRSTESAKDYTDSENKKLDQMELLKRLTKEWVDDGIYLTEDGKLAINASAIRSGIIQAALIQAGVLQSKDGKTFVLDLDNNTLKAAFSELSISGKTVDEIAKSAADAAEKAAKDAATDALNNYAETVTKDIEELQSQIDGSITSWFGDVVPTNSNEPAVNWTAEELKNQHLGDLYYINEGVEQGGTVYRWALISGAYKWVIVEDTDVAKALAAAAQAQDTADSKRRVFVAQPTPPYDVGDLWAQGSGGDLMRCKTARASGTSYLASDWELASKYIDATQAGDIAKNKVDAQTQEDIFNKLTNNGAAQGIYLENNLLYINASYIGTGIIKADLIDADNLKIKAANITGTLTIGQLPAGVATTDQLMTETGVVNIVKGTITADYVNALALKVNAANITGKLTAAQIDASELKVDAANITGTIEANTINAVDGYIGGWTITDRGLFRGTSGTDNFIGLYSQHPNTAATIGGLSSANWRIVAGTSFGVTRDGKLAASDAIISGTIYAENGSFSGDITGATGTIGQWTFGTCEGYTGIYSRQALDANGLAQATVMLSAKYGIGMYTSAGWEWVSWYKLMNG